VLPDKLSDSHRSSVGRTLRLVAQRTLARWRNRGNQRGDMQRIFQDIHRHRLWGDGESASGPGSSLERTSVFRDEFAALLSKLGSKSLLDAGCGDFNWQRAIDVELDTYVGVDLVPELIDVNLRTYSSNRIRFLCADISRDPLPRCDVILCRDCLVHFSFADIAATLGNFKNSGSIYLLTTTFIDARENLDIRTGEWRPLNLERPPFLFPPPLAMVDERCLHSGGIYADKRFGLWSLADVNCDRIGTASGQSRRT
jgi:SAM-dependent methyltransferase